MKDCVPFSKDFSLSLCGLCGVLFVDFTFGRDKEFVLSTSAVDIYRTLQSEIILSHMRD